jgi:hypothetical protein
VGVESGLPQSGFRRCIAGIKVGLVCRGWALESLSNSTTKQYEGVEFTAEAGGHVPGRLPVAHPGPVTYERPLDLCEAMPALLEAPAEAGDLPDALASD